MVSPAGWTRRGRKGAAAHLTRVGLHHAPGAAWVVRGVGARAVVADGLALHFHLPRPTLIPVVRVSCDRRCDREQERGQGIGGEYLLLAIAWSGPLERARHMPAPEAA
jgi:hypothetical protein